jgi:hypothetical protein
VHAKTLGDSEEDDEITDAEEVDAVSFGRPFRHLQSPRTSLLSHFLRVVVHIKQGSFAPG